MSGPVARQPFRFTIPGAEIRGDAWLPTANDAGAALVICHGFKGFKDWGFFPHVSHELAARTGLPTVCFNFDGSGVRESTDEFDDLEAFARNTFTRELQDLEAVLDRLARGRLGEVSVPRASAFGLLGHSRGGATCLLKASVRTQVRALVTWSAVGSINRYLDDFAAVWEAGERVTIPNVRTGQQMLLERNVMDDIRANGDRLDVGRAAVAIEIPYLIVHGTEDEAVQVSDAESLARAAPRWARLELIEGAGHTFGARHPFAGSTPHLDRAVATTIDHFRAAFP